MSWNTEGVRKVERGAIQEKLCQDGGLWRVRLEQLTCGLHLCHCVHEIWYQPAPHLLGGLADNQNVLRRLHWGMAELTSWTEV